MDINGLKKLTGEISLIQSKIIGVTWKSLNISRRGALILSGRKQVQTHDTVPLQVIFVVRIKDHLPLDDK